MKTKKILGIVAVLALVAMALVGAGAAESSYGMQIWTTTDGTTWSQVDGVTDASSFVTKANLISGNVTAVEVRIVSGGSYDFRTVEEELAIEIPTKVKVTGSLTHDNLAAIYNGTINLQSTLTLDSSCGLLTWNGSTWNYDNILVTVDNSGNGFKFDGGKIVINGGATTFNFHTSPVTDGNTRQIEVGYGGIEGWQMVNGMITLSPGYTGILEIGSDVYNTETNPTVFIPAGTTIDTSSAEKVITIPDDTSAILKGLTVEAEKTVTIDGDGDVILGGTVNGRLNLDINAFVDKKLYNYGTIYYTKILAQVSDGITGTGEIEPGDDAKTGTYTEDIYSDLSNFTIDSNKYLYVNQAGVTFADVLKRLNLETTGTQPGARVIIDNPETNGTSEYKATGTAGSLVWVPVNTENHLNLFLTNKNGQSVDLKKVKISVTKENGEPEVFTTESLTPGGDQYLDAGETINCSSLISSNVTAGELVRVVVIYADKHILYDKEVVAL